MKNMLFLLLLPIAFVQAQPEKKTDSKITNVTVFLNRAQVTRQAQARLEAGKTFIILHGLTASLDPETITVTGKGNFVLLGLSHRQNFMNEVTRPRSLRVIEDSILWYQRAVLIAQNQKEILNKEEQLLLGNQKISGTQNLTVAELKAMADFFRTRLADINQSRLKEDDRVNTWTARITRLQQQAEEQRQSFNNNTSEIVVSVSASEPTDASLEINYMVNNAGWVPMYDVRAINTKSPLQLNYKANVFQATGEEWPAVHLILSTANPSLGGLKPELSPWYLDFYRPVARMHRYAENAKSMAGAPAEVMQDKKEDEATLLAEYVTAVQTTLNTQFEIGIPYTVSSAGKPTQVDIARHEIKADYIYATTPKLDADAFLLAKATGWEELNLLPGEANIFFEGTFVGKTVIDPAGLQDTLKLSLGRDKRIVVKREKVKDFTTRRTFGGSQRDSYAWEISVRNTGPNAIRIVVEDQLPVSQNNQIEVTTQDTGGARVDVAQGKLVWELQLNPAETKKVSYRFEVKYPKGVQLNGF